MKKISLFDQDLLVRDFVCSSSKDVLYPSDVSLRLYIKMTDCCNAEPQRELLFSKFMIVSKKF